jgi:hypothetical protein
MTAIDKRHPATARLLFDRGARVDRKSGSGSTALHYAARANDPGLVELLVGKGAEVDAPDVYGLTPLFHAAVGGNVDALEALIAAGAEVNRKADPAGGTALLAADRHGRGNAPASRSCFARKRGSDRRARHGRCADAADAVPRNFVLRMLRCTLVGHSAFPLFHWVRYVLTLRKIGFLAVKATGIHE